MREVHLIHMPWEAQSKMQCSVGSPPPLHSVTVVTLYHRTSRSVISLRTSQVPAIKYTVSLKCKLTNADEWPAGDVWKVSQERETLCIDSIDPALLEGQPNGCTAVFSDILNTDV